MSHDSDYDSIVIPAPSAGLLLGSGACRTLPTWHHMLPCSSPGHAGMLPDLAGMTRLLTRLRKQRSSGQHGRTMCYRQLLIMQARRQLWQA